VAFQGPTTEDEIGVETGVNSEGGDEIECGRVQGAQISTSANKIPLLDASSFIRLKEEKILADREPSMSFIYTVLINVSIALATIAEE
jgi:hypothetical protein